MNNATAFWNKAAQSLPAPYQARYRGYFERAQKWELAIDVLIELFSRPKQAPRRDGLNAI